MATRVSDRSLSADDPYILAFGDSLTAGYGLDAKDNFASQLERALRAHAPFAQVYNAGLSGDTSAGALGRLPALLSSLKQRPDLAIVEFGANDFLRNIPPEHTHANLDRIVVELRRCGIPVLLTAMEAPRFLGEFAERCDAVYARLGRTHTIPVVPFFPVGVLAKAGLTLRDGIHPNRAAIRLVVEALLPAVLAALPQRHDVAA